MPDAAGLTGGRLLARNSILNLVGHGLPLVVALAAIPLLIRSMGTERFGVLTLAWMAIGYFSLFDFGLGRALTQVVAERMGAGQRDEVPVLTWTALLLMLGLGGVGAVVLALLSPWLVGSALRIPPALQGEALAAFFLLAISLPFVISTAALRGVLEAVQRFDLVNAVRIPLGVLTYLGPLLVLPFTNRLPPVVAVLVVGRVIAWAVHLWLCLHALPELRARPGLRWGMVGPLLRFGTWMTVTNIVSPLMVYLDRFFIGAFLSMSAVAFYVTPYEAVTKLWLIPGALLGVLFPAFAASFARDPQRTAVLFGRAVRIMVLLLFPLMLLLVTLAPEVLGLWLGADFTARSTSVLRWLAVGVLINSVGQVPFSVIQSVGRPDVTGKLHLIELPLYFAAMLWLLDRHGIAGVAIAWTLRATLDTAVLFFFACRMLSGSAAVLRRMIPTAAAVLAALGGGMLLNGLAAKVVFLVAVLGAFGASAWLLVLHSDERAVVRRFVGGWNRAPAHRSSTA
jgi:O-antigen/teichoic acid export membrane protein